MRFMVIVKAGEESEAGVPCIETCRAARHMMKC
jgi:hypothetical protein